MKITFEFDTLDPDQKEEYEIHKQAIGIYRAAWEFGHNTKRRLNALSPELIAGYEKSLEDFFQHLSEYNVSLEV